MLFVPYCVREVVAVCVTLLWASVPNSHIVTLEFPMSPSRPNIREILVNVSMFA